MASADDDNITNRPDSRGLPEDGGDIRDDDGRFQVQKRDYDIRRPDLRHAEFGVIACVLGVLSLLILALCGVLPAMQGALGVGTRGWLAIVSVVTLGCSSVGALLAAIGLMQINRKKGLAVVGLCLNGLSLVCGVLVRMDLDAPKGKTSLLRPSTRGYGENAVFVARQCEHRT
jgi:hypothetical protein